MDFFVFVQFQLLCFVLIVVGLWALVSINVFLLLNTFELLFLGSVQCVLNGYNSSKHVCDHNISLDHCRWFGHDRCWYWVCTCCEIRESINFKASVSLNTVNGEHNR